jgi:gamma-glutamyl hercynylcysteine S-oxide hydrolase
MCRLLAWLGDPVDLEWLLYGQPHSLHRQSWEPREQQHGVVNADGWGVGWYQPDRREEPARYRTTKPMWGDANFRSMAGVIRSGAVLAAVRSATPPSPIDEVNTPPFVSGRWLLAHNGAVDGWREGVGEALRRELTERRASEIQGSTDTEVLFALALDQLDKGAPPADALSSVVEQVTTLTTGRLNLVMTDGRTVAATAWGDTLYRSMTDEAFVLASEPFDDQRPWERLDDRTTIAHGEEAAG